MFVADKDFQAGYIACQQGQSRESCPLLFDAKPRNMWMHGYDFAELEKSENPPEDELKRVERSPFDQGREAFKQGVDYADNPYGEGDLFGTPEEKETNLSNRDWHSGWSWEKAGGGTVEPPKRQPTPGVYDPRNVVYRGTLYLPGVYPGEGKAPAEPNGGFVSYYLASVEHPQRKEQPAYTAECEDISRALQMTPDEFCEFKAIWRTAAARLGNTKPGHNAVYDAQKRVHYATISLAIEMRKQSK